MKKTLIFLYSCLFLFIFCDISFAWKGSIESGGMYKTGNIEEFSSLTAIKVQKENLNNRLTLGGQFEYSDNNHIKENEKIYIYQIYEQDLFDSTDNPSNKATGLFWLMEASFEYNYIENLERRIMMGPGLGIYFLNNKKIKLSTDTGVNYCIEKYNNKSVKDIANSRVRQKMEISLVDNIDFLEQCIYYPKLDDKEDYRITTMASLKIRTKTNVTLKITYENEYINKPTHKVDKKHANNGIILSVCYEF